MMRPLRLSATFSCAANCLQLLLLFLLVSPLQNARAEEDIRVWFSNPRNVQPGSLMHISLMMASSQQLGGVDFRIRYDDSYLSFVSIEQDTGLSNWEYFQYSHNDSLNTVKMFFIAEAGSLLVHPDSSDLHPNGSIVDMQFFVSPTWLTDSGRVLFDYFWLTCGSNSASDLDGDTLISVRRIFDEQGQLIWDETDDINYPDANRPPNFGVPDSCLQAADKVEMKIDLYYGEATNYYICGDANGDDAVTISDAVRIVNFIFGGGSPPNPLISGDVNCSGDVTISDAVNLVNYIFGGGPEPCAGCS